MRLIDLFDRGAERAPERVFLKDAYGELTFRQTRARGMRIANALLGLGLSRPKAAVYSPNSVAAFECVLGVVRAGGIWVPVNARNAIAENCYILDNCDTEVLFYHGSFEPQIGQIRAECPKIRHFVCLDKAGGHGVWLEDFIRDAAETDPDVAVSANDVVALFSSGGTTGRPKGVMLTNLNFTTMTANFAAAMPVDAPPVHLVIAPMTHAAGCVAIALMPHGATNVILPQFDAKAVMETIERERVTHLFLPPTAIYMLLAHPDVRKHDYSSLRNFVYAAAPMSADKLQECLDVFGPVMTQTFGQAEALMICTYLSPQDHVAARDGGHAERLLSCGRPAMFTALGIMDDDGRLLPAGERGEIVVRGNLVMAGYYRNPQATEEASAFGWHHTGDIGVRDAEGFVYVVDRKKDMIISGGFNVYPSEIEQVIWSLPEVQDCAVIGVPDPKWGEAVKAVIELKPGRSLTEEDVLAVCRQRLGGVKTPKTVEFWPTLPRTPVGKVRKKDIRERFWQGQARTI